MGQGRPVGAHPGGVLMRLVLCDRHRLFAESFAHVLETVDYAVGLVASPEQAVEAVTSAPTAACVMEVDFGSDRVVSAIEAIHEASPHTRVVILSAMEDPRVLAPVLAVGVAGVVSKEQGLNHILDTISRLINGAMRAGQRAHASGMDARGSSRGDRRGISELTPREQEVLRHLALGHGTGFLARTLGVSYSTARTHIQNVLAKLDVHSRLEAVALVHQQNMSTAVRPAARMDESLVPLVRRAAL